MKGFYVWGSGLPRQINTTEPYQSHVDTLNRRGQNWTIDLLVGVAIFMSIALLFYSIASGNLGEQTQFEASADPLINKLDRESQPEGYNATPTPFNGYSVNETELKELYASDYDTITSQLDIQGEFCLTVVENGSLVPLNVSGNDQFSYGENDSDVLIGNNLSCGQ